MVFPIRHRRKPTRFETVNTRPITTNTIHFNLNVNRAVKNRQTWTWLDFTEMNLKAFPYPDHREGYQATPEYLDLSPRELVGLRRGGLEHPDGVSLVIDIIPPAQPSHDATSDVLDGPEVHGEQEDDGHKATYEVV